VAASAGAEAKAAALRDHLRRYLPCGRGASFNAISPARRTDTRYGAWWRIGGGAAEGTIRRQNVPVAAYLGEQMLRLVRSNPRFRLLFVGSSLSTFGDTALYLTLPIWIKVLLNSNSAAGAVFFALGIASLATPFAGVLVDRLSRRRLLIGVNVAMGLVVASLFLVRGPRQAWLIYPVALVYGAGMNLVSGARTGMLKDLVDDRDLGAANAALLTTSTGLRLLAPLVGAGLFTLFGGWVVVLLDVVTFAVAVLCVWPISVVESRRSETADRSFFHELTAGVTFVRRSPVLLRMVVASGLAFLMLGLYENIPFALIGNGLHRPPSLFGVLASLQGIGAVAAGIVIAKVIARLSELRTFALGLGVMVAATALLILQSLPVVLVGCVVMGLSLPMMGVSFATAIQRHTPGRLLGRVSSAGQLVVGGCQTLSVGVGAALIAVIDYRLLLVAIIAVLLPAAAVLLLRGAPPAGEPATESDDASPPVESA
jgi:MFS family permease